MKRFLFVLIAISSLQMVCAQRTEYNFNLDWLLHIGDIEGAEKPSYNDKTWKSISLPRAWNEDEVYKVAIDKLSTGVVWYRKHFSMPSSSKGKKVFVEFEGVRFGADVYVNGTHVGLFENGVMAFGIDMTEYLKSGDNVIALRIDNDWSYREKSSNTRFQWNDKNFNVNYGGIPKNVRLHVCDKLYQTLPLYDNLKTTGTYIYAKEIDITKRRAVIFAESEVSNETSSAQIVKLHVAIDDVEGKRVAVFEGDTATLQPGQKMILKAHKRVEDLNFWSWGYGYLYKVRTSLSVGGKLSDEVCTTTGFRKTAFRDGMFYLNDRVLQLKGYAQRTSNEWPGVGMSVPAWLSDYSNRLMVESNANLVRWMHVTPWKQDVESCDRVGLIQAMPAGDAEKDREGRQWQQRTELMRNAIIYNRNNPSIIFYESGNESISEAHMADMKAIRDQYDPYGGRAIGSREMLDSKVAEYGGEMLYINKSAHIPMWAMEYCRDEALRMYWDDYSYPYHKDGDGPLHKGKDASAYNRNQDSFFKESIIRWWDYYRERPGTGKRCSSGGVNIVFSDTQTHFRGAENYRRSGEVDAMRIPKDAFYAHQVMWNGWVDVEQHSTYICGHWNYEQDVIKDVMVASSGEKVELFLNGKSLGCGERSYGFLFTFSQVAYQPGILEAVSYDDNGRELSRDKKETAGEPHHLTMKLIGAPDSFKADGSDILLAEIEVVDKNGRRWPVAFPMLSFVLEGEAGWRGGIAKGEDNYAFAKTLPAECGIARVMLRSTRKAGAGKLTVSSEGLGKTEVSFKSVAAKSNKGLYSYISGDYQPVFLGRGATPKETSYTESRHSLDIVSATAAVNEEKTFAAFDDNELSEWTNDGRLSTGWITFELKEDAIVEEMTIKLTGWRMRAYPIAVFVDDVEVYRGTTEKSLGYITIPLKPTKGRFVKIALQGSSTEDDAFGSIVEITGTKELDLYKSPNATNAKGQLRIVEVEFYGEK